jgi:hypothetical protein
MESLKPPKTFKVYALIKQSGLNLSYVYGAGSSVVYGAGFYQSQQEAEQYRTLEILRDTESPSPSYHVFELEIPNPAYQE